MELFYFPLIILFIYFGYIVSKLPTFICPIKKGDNQMETWYYRVVSIEGDYANLKRTDMESNDLKLVARALLPAEIYEGCILKYEWMQYFMQ